MIVAIVTAEIIEGKQNRLREVADILQYQFAAHEEGCEQYESFIDGNTFLTIERWRTRALLDKHLAAEHVAIYVPQLRECVVGGVFAVQFLQVAAIELTVI